MASQWSKVLPGALIVGGLFGCQADQQEAATQYDYQADIRYTQYGVPHIEAANYASLGYGIAYAQVEENLCTLAEQVRNIQSLKSRYLGAGEKKQNLLSDIGYKALGLPAQAALKFPSLEQSAQDLLRGYSDGFNAQLAKHKTPQDYPSPCRGADWVTPITPELLLAMHLDLALLASGRSFIPAIAAAAPPKNEKLAAVEPVLKAVLDEEHVLTSEGIGSNGWALGKERVSGANSALMANPHFPWDGELRFYQQHLTIPGEIDVIGVGMIGMPGVSIGFNKDLGWTHTVSQSKRFTLYQLELDPANPLRYRYGEEMRDMSSRDVSIDIKQDDGSLAPYQHTLYFSHYGPIINLGSLAPTLGWNSKTALTYRDANSGNSGMLEQWTAMGKASNSEEFFQAFNTHQAIPWVNTMMVDREGTASYLDGSQAPMLSAKAEAYWRSASQTPQLAPIWRDGAGSILLPGSDPAFEWQDVNEGRAPGLTPFSKAPQLQRKDYVFNSNSSHWLSNIEQPLEGYSIAYGPERSHRSPRSRYNAQLISDTSAQGPAGEDGKFSLDELKAVFTNNGSLFAKTLLPSLRQRCHQQDSIELDGTAFELKATCEALDQWDGQYQLESRGAQLMREFLAQFRVKGHRDVSDALFANDFNWQQAASTPGALAPAPSTGTDPIVEALARASQRLSTSGIALDAALKDIQYVLKAEDQAPIPVSGGYSYEGVFNFAQARSQSRGHSELATVNIGKAVNTSKQPGTPLRQLDSDIAYPVNYGSSFVMALEYTDAGPKADMFLSYSQSHDPESEHFRDQSERFSALQWRPVLFSEKQIADNLVRHVKLRENK